jgi:SAM-dependent methyltransferase
MANSDAASHWRDVYAHREPERLSWFESTPKTSLAWIAKANLPADAAILDAGGGPSKLAGELVRLGYTDVTVADIAAGAIERAKAELGDIGTRITWMQADLRSHDFDRLYDLWHDRAVFHFMVDDADRDGYLAVLRSAIRPGGHLILAVFGPQGPTECSGLPVRRYGAEQLSALLVDDFQLLGSQIVDHHTPAGAKQQFVYVHLRRNEKSPS